MNLILHILCVSGVCLIVCTGGIFRPTREFLRKHSVWMGKLICCPMCMGTWSGWAVRAFMVVNSGGTLVPMDLIYGPIGSISAWYLITTIGLVEELDTYWKNKNISEAQKPN